VTLTVIIITLYLFAGTALIGMFSLCWQGWHDGTMTGKNEIERDIREDL
jgi:hypothetical protein